MSAAHSGRGFHAPTTCRLPPSVLRLVLADIRPGHDTNWPRLESMCPWAQVAALAGSPVAEAARDILSAADNSWREVEPVLAQAEEVCPLSGAVPGMQCLASPGELGSMHSSRACSTTMLCHRSWGQSLGQTHRLMHTSMLGCLSMEIGAWLLCPPTLRLDSLSNCTQTQLYASWWTCACESVSKPGSVSADAS